ncbi:hypothetical protein [Anaerocolumna chitinilytica]|uniref:Uncharacterized protein n=1 Tax=Anaerocolumna chitinilytica TaxID=1727145 RepID=A0A7I8DI55_9FIRM|nr:hypothetical protein [Anaerocolumna chitinilytica]BCJ98133.1 hypothetical protein bsdcttw_11740 [Anaerocolumna chitinilytica]
MFNSQELSLVQTRYFSDYSYINGVIEIRSKNTGHWWQIVKKDMPRAKMVIVRHRYPGVKKYHLQCHVHTFEKTIRMIIEHDKYVLSDSITLTNAISV